MDNWSAMFGEVRRVVRQSLPLEESLAQVIKFAEDNPALYDEVKHWRQLKSHDFRPAFDTVVGWGKAGIAQITPSEGCEFLLLDLGDWSESFRIYRLGRQDLMSEPKLRALLGRKLVVGGEALKGCFATVTENAYDLVFRNAQNLTYHHTSELGDVLDWADGSDIAEDHGNNGCLLWLLLGSLALLAPFKDTDHCMQALQGREKLYLLSGFESLFTSLATVTNTGLVYEEV